ncbi:MAG TPA: chemotaxis protein CheA [Opitutaceae bacterium]|nr:chemotaxis protein CheA [Opitutaceae bacterium]
MSIAPVLLQQVEDITNRIAAEAILAQPGRDDGLIPAYSLLGQLCDLLADHHDALFPAQTLRELLEKRLDAAQPFDADSLAHLQHFAEHYPRVLDALRAGKPVQFKELKSGGSTGAAAPVAARPAFSAPPDQLMDMKLEENRELLAEFHAEAVDHLSQIEAALLQLEQNPTDAEAISSIFRSFHTIKGVSGFLQLTPMHTLTHEVESLLDLVRNNKLALTSTIITEMLRARDALQALVGQITIALEKGVLPTEIVPVGHLIIAVKTLAAGGNAKVAPAPAEAFVAPAPTPVAAEEATVASVLTEVPPPEPTAVAAAPAVPNQTALQQAAAAPAAGAKKSNGPSTIRVNTEKLDSLMDVVGELVIVQSQLQESARHLIDNNTALQRNLAQVSRITKELQHTSMALRMIPVKATFQKMERLARDLARDCGKKVSFTVEGEDTELDRTVVEEINDPLVHMVRNSLDHGLESAAERLRLGKTEAGKVQLKAYHQGSNIVLEISDDGRGIDPAKVFAKALKQGLVAEGQNLSREETLNLIFLPGFSTAEKVTSISGRGVGMDVVRRNIEKLRGKIEIDSEIGKGSRFRIILPLTMAIIDGLIVKVGEDRFILPTTSVKMAYRPAAETISTVQGRGEVLDLRGKIIPLHRLHEKFAIEPKAHNPADGIVVVVEFSGRTSGLLVDEMVSKQEVVIKSLGALMQGLPGVAGGAILGDGNIALILDPASLLNAA